MRRRKTEGEGGEERRREEKGEGGGGREEEDRELLSPLRLPLSSRSPFICLQRATMQLGGNRRVLTGQ